MICLQLNRLRFEDGQLVKKLSPMSIEPVIYGDRFMVQNRAKIEEIRLYVHTLREKVKALEAKLSEYRNFDGNSNYDLQKILALAA